MSDVGAAFNKAFSEAVLQIHSTQTAGDFASSLCMALRRLVGGDFVVFDWVDRRQSLSVACQMYPERQIPDELCAYASSLAPSQSPVWLRCSEQPYAISDFIERRDWERRDLHWAYTQIGQKDSLGIDIPLSPSLILRLRDIRSRFGAYTSEERRSFSLLAPHIGLIYSRLMAEKGFCPFPTPVRHVVQVTLDARGHAALWPKRARELLTNYGAKLDRGRLSGGALDWFRESTRSVAPHSLQLQRQSGRLHFHLVRGPDLKNYRLVLQETDAVPSRESALTALGISLRECEVLHWVVEGKTNAEIAIILGLKEGTVRRHLENIFPKLGVENRHAAAAAVRHIFSTQARNGTL